MSAGGLRSPLNSLFSPAIPAQFRDSNRISIYKTKPQTTDQVAKQREFDFYSNKCQPTGII